jgi:hypothetical protein
VAASSVRILRAHRSPRIFRVRILNILTPTLNGRLYGRSDWQCQNHYLQVGKIILKEDHRFSQPDSSLSMMPSVIVFHPARVVDALFQVTDVPVVDPRRGDQEMFIENGRNNYCALSQS